MRGLSKLALLAVSASAVQLATVKEDPFAKAFDISAKDKGKPKEKAYDKTGKLDEKVWWQKFYWALDMANYMFQITVRKTDPTAKVMRPEEAEEGVKALMDVCPSSDGSTNL